MIVSVKDISIYCVLVDRETGEKEFRFAESLGEICRYAGKIECFSDIDDTYYVEAIIENGREIQYAGWRPGMEVVFIYSDTGEVAYEFDMPQWDH